MQISNISNTISQFKNYVIINYRIIRELVSPRNECRYEFDISVNSKTGNVLTFESERRRILFLMIGYGSPNRSVIEV